MWQVVLIGCSLLQLFLVLFFLVDNKGHVTPTLMLPKRTSAYMRRSQYLRPAITHLWWKPEVKSDRDVYVWVSCPVRCSKPRASSGQQSTNYLLTHQNQAAVEWLSYDCHHLEVSTNTMSVKLKGENQCLEMHVSRFYTFQVVRCPWYRPLAAQPIEANHVFKRV